MEETFKHLMVAGDFRSLAFQFGFCLINTLLLIYLVALTTRSFTYIKSHTWLFIDTVVATTLSFGLYRFCVGLGLKYWMAVLLLTLLSVVVEGAVKVVDQGRALVDIDAERKRFFQTDYRLIRRSSIFVVILMIVIWTSTAGRK